jgi:D-glycero-alpha-D-manno-heptose-7-phosphate kinase
MIISKTPFRISFFGGGTDYPAWYFKHNGAVLSTAIDKFCYINCRILPRFFEHKYRVVWSHIENVSCIGEILHPAVREGLRYMKINNDIGLEIQHQGDLPARTGMGSSSSFVVGFFKVICALKGQIIGKHEVALKAIHFEQEILKDHVGSQDQMAAAYGGFNVFQFNSDGTIHVEPVTLSKDRKQELESHLMMFYTGTSRLSSEIAGDIISNIFEKERQLKRMHEMVYEAVDILNGPGSILEFGQLLNETWQLKRQLSDHMSNPVIERLYEVAMENGAVGGKLLGAGSAGFMVFLVPPEKKEQLKKSMAGYLNVPFKFENEGSTLIHYSGEEIQSYAE